MKMMRRFSWYLAPPILQGIVSFATLPIATLVLGPTEYGMYALVTSITALATGIAGISASYPLAAHFKNSDEAGRRALVTTLVTLNLMIALFLGTVIIGTWWVFGHESGEYAKLPTEAVLIAVASMITAAPWFIGVELSVTLGQARVYGLTLMAQSLIGAVVLIGSLFVLNLGMLSLFVAGLASSMVALLGAWVAMRRYLSARAGIRDGLRFLHGVPILTVASLLEVVQVAVERNVMAVHLGMAQVGIYSHSQQYRNLLATGVKAIARTVWPTSLDEARVESGLLFRKTHLVWNVTYLAIVLFGLCFAIFGDKIISLLTHDKFTDAYVLVAVWAAYLLVQNSGKAQTAMLYAHGRGKAIARISSMSTLLGIVVAIAAIPVFGVFGAAGAVILQQIALRIGLQVYVRKYWAVHTDDWWVIGGSVIVIAALALVVISKPNLWERTALLLILSSVILVAGRRWSAEALQLMRDKNIIANSGT
jgi:O-antigen/teichoic acid export membrane protein